MSTFEVSININASVEQVWVVLADIGTIDKWNPGVTNSYKTNSKENLGASRHCDLKGKSYLKEDVVKWIPNESLTMGITETNLPFQSADINFTLQSDSDRTRVTVSPVYQLKYGLLGKLLDKMFVHNTYKKGMIALLEGLKNYVEELKIKNTPHNNG